MWHKVEVSVEVKIGVGDSGRELILTSNLTPDRSRRWWPTRLKKPRGAADLVDDKGRRYIVPAAGGLRGVGTADTARWVLRQGLTTQFAVKATFAALMPMQELKADVDHDFVVIGVVSGQTTRLRL